MEGAGESKAGSHQQAETVKRALPFEVAPSLYEDQEEDSEEDSEED